MKLINLVYENQYSSYNNWTRFTDQSLHDDFQEYKYKEMSKWQPRSSVIGSRWPIFQDIQDFQSALVKSPIVEIDKLSSVLNLTKNHSISDIKDMVSTYSMPRDVNRIIQGFKQNAAMPLPIILQGSKNMWIMAGNTRQSVARVMGITPRALLVDVSDKP